MKAALLIAVPCGAFLTIVAWRLTELLSPDAVALALGLALGVLAGVPSMALVAMARRRDEEGDYIDAPMTYAGLPQIPDRQTEIETLRAALHYLEGEAQR